MRQTIISSIICAILFGTLFTFFSFISGSEDLLLNLKIGAITGAFYGLFDPQIQKWRQKNSKPQKD